MKLLYLSTVYPAYAREFAARPRPEGHFAAVSAEFEADAFGWAGAWGPALAPHGIEVRELWLNVEPMQRAWARENGLPAEASLEDIARAQYAAFAPDVIWYDYGDRALLARLREARGARALGWVGTMLGDEPIWRDFDLVLSCAPESVRGLRDRGVRAEYLAHAFQPRVLHRVVERSPEFAVSFVGQIAADHPLHGDRERVLERLLGRVDLAIFGTASGSSSGATLAARKLAWSVARALRAAGVPAGTLRRVPLLGRASQWAAEPRAGVSAELTAAIRPPRFGVAMYQTLRDSRVTLNVHGGPPPRFSSNMRLFEATGVGACLLTDEAVNLPELFEPNREIATFRNADECLEKSRWLLDHERERQAIAAAGQKRCLAAHTFEHRAPQLVEYLLGVVTRNTN